MYSIQSTVQASTIDDALNAFIKQLKTRPTYQGSPAQTATVYAWQVQEWVTGQFGTGSVQTPGP